MSVTLTNVGTPEAGAGTAAGVAGSTSQTIWPPQSQVTGPDGQVVPVLPYAVIQDRAQAKITVRVNSTQAFRLNYFYSADLGTTFVPSVDQVASSTVNLDGGAAGYTNAAELDIDIGLYFYIAVWNTSGSPANYIFDYRRSNSTN